MPESMLPPRLPVSTSVISDSTLSPLVQTLSLRMPSEASAWADEARSLLMGLGMSAGAWLTPSDPSALLSPLISRCPIDGRALAEVSSNTLAQADSQIRAAAVAQRDWRDVPAPQRAALIRQLMALVRQHQPSLARLISLETGKIASEASGEVQEVIDIAEFAIGLSRQLYGLTMPSERPDHVLRETWHPLGCIGVITAFNFPLAVWAWNATLALVCGNAVVWKPSEKTPLCALAMHTLCQIALQMTHPAMTALCPLILGNAALGQTLVDHSQVQLISATGSTRMGRAVALACAPRFKRTLLELGGNNAAVICASADLDLALPAIIFSAFGTAGQRCTTLRRLFVHRSIYEGLVTRLLSSLPRLKVGNPLRADTLIGPLIDIAAEQARQHTLSEARALGALIHGGERVFPEEGRTDLSAGVYVNPTLIETTQLIAPMQRETFAPVLYVVPFDTLNEAITLNNAAEHGLSSAIFTRDLREAEHFLSAHGADTGLANVNLGTSGAEIGGAFGGEKDTGGGRESGSDAWKQYMRRATNTLNYGLALPLAQGVQFDLGESPD